MTFTGSDYALSTGGRFHRERLARLFGRPAGLDGVFESVSLREEDPELTWELKLWRAPSGRFERFLGSTICGGELADLLKATGNGLRRLPHLISRHYELIAVDETPSHRTLIFRRCQSRSPTSKSQD
jgi:hypothetical protein